MIDFKNDSKQLQIQKLEYIISKCMESNIVSDECNILCRFKELLTNDVVLTEKQEKYCQILLQKIDDVTKNGIYTPDDSTLNDIEIIIARYESVTTRYQLRYASLYTVRSLNRLHTWFYSEERNNINLDKNDLNRALRWANGTLKKIKNPKFKLGELAYYKHYSLSGDVAYEPIVVMSLPHVSSLSKSTKHFKLVIDALYKSQITQLDLNYIFKRIPRQT